MPSTSSESGNKHALDLLPYELWREIFFHTTESWLYKIRASPDITSSFHPIDYELQRKEMRNKIRLLLICKSLQAVAEEHLDTEVTLTSLSSFDGFLACASTTRPHGRRRGEWTRSLILNTPASMGFPSSFKARLDQLGNTCPTLLSLCVLEGGFDWPGMQFRNLDWCKKLQTLYWNGSVLGWADITDISIHSTNLYQLDLRSVVEGAPTTGTIMFPTVCHLSLSWVCYQNMDIMMLILPKLKKLSIEVIGSTSPRPNGRPNPVVEFLQREGHKLIALELRTEGWNVNTTDFNVFEVCKNLSTFLVRADALPEIQEKMTPYTSLAQLVLFFDRMPPDVHDLWAKIISGKDPEEEKDDMAVNPRLNASSHTKAALNQKQHAKDFALQRFPNLRSVLVAIIPNPITPNSRIVIPESDRLVLKQCMAALFTNANVLLVDHL